MNVYEKLTIIDERRVKNKVLCRCECGTEKWINIFNIRKGDVKSCGCLKKNLMKKIAPKRFKGKCPSNFKDYTGRKIGVMSVLKRIKIDSSETWYLIQCECGNQLHTRISSLRRSRYFRCTCGFSNHTLKRTLQRIRMRCENFKDKSFKWYGAKKVYVCEEWKKFPVKFIEWSINNGWKSGLTINRIDSKGPYSPENCEWITRSDNARKAAEKRWEQKILE